MYPKICPAAWTSSNNEKIKSIILGKELPHMQHLFPWTYPQPQGFCSYLDGTDSKRQKEKMVTKQFFWLTYLVKEQ